MSHLRTLIRNSCSATAKVVKMFPRFVSEGDHRWNRYVGSISLALSLLLPICSQAADFYFGRETMQTPPDTSSGWQVNGQAAHTTAGLNVTEKPGASYLYQHLNLYTSSGYAVSATLHLTQSGGNYVFYLQSTPDAVFGLVSGKVHSKGSFYAVAIQEPKFDAASCSAMAALYRVTDGHTKILQAARVPCDQQITYHAIVGLDNRISFMADGLEFLTWTDQKPLAGIAGVGGYAMPVGNSMVLSRWAINKHV